MPVVDTLANIQQIQSRLDELFAPKAPKRADSAASAALFADVLGATGAGSVKVTAPQGSNATGSDLATAAAKYEGVPYVFGGKDLSAGGLDCSGLVQLAFKDLGIDVPRGVDGQRHLGVEVPSLDQAKVGDLVVSANGDHIGIWMGNGKIIHSPYPGRDVSIVDNYLAPSDIVTIRRILPETQPLASLGGTDLATAAQLAALRGGFA